MRQRGTNTVSYALIALMALIGLSCQKAVEPTDVTADMTTTIEVRDGAQKVVPGASVLWALSVAGTRTTPLTPMAQVATGIFTAKIPVPLAAENTLVVFQIDPPTTAEFAGETTILDSIKVCLDTTLVYQFNRQVSLNCGTVVNDQFDLYCDLSKESQITGCTPEYTNNTGAQLDLSATSTPSLPTSTATELFIGSSTTPLPLNTPIPPGARFKVCFTFTFPPGSSSSRNSYGITLTGTTNGQPCFTANIVANVEAVAATSCDCPTSNIDVDYPSATTEETICVGDQEKITIPIGPLRNTNESCDLRLRLASGQGDQEFAVLSLDGGSPTERTLSPGNSVSSIDVRFAPQSRQAYVRQIVYTLQKENPDGSFSDCPTQLRVNFHGRGGEAICAVVRTPATDTTLVVIDSTFQQCVDGDDQAQVKRYCIFNSGECDLNVSASVTANPAIFHVSPANLTVAPGTTECFEVRFNPRTVDYWPPNGDRNNPVRTDFTGSLTITGLPSCSPGTISLSGKAMFPCLRFNDNCYKEWGAKGGEYKVGVSLLPGGSLLSEPRDQKDSLAIFVESFNSGTTPTSVTLSSGKPTGGNPFALFRRVDNIRLTQNENICQRTGQYSSLCDGTGTQTISNVVEGDVLLLTFELYGQKFCAVMWIRAIRLDRTNDPANAVPEVCFEVCYPI